MMCFAPDCKHYNEKHMCKFFVFPKDSAERRRWIKLIRRADKEPNNGSRICSCHFKDGLKENGPTMFEHNATRRLAFPSPPGKKKLRSVDKLPVDKNVEETIDEENAAVANPVEVQSSLPSTGSILMEAENMLLHKELKDITNKLQKLEMSFSFTHIENQDDLVLLYTGLPNKTIFLSLFHLLENVEKNYYLDWNVECITAVGQLFLTLYKLRQNPPHKDLAQRFNCSTSTVTNIFMTWLHLLHEVIFCKLMSFIPTRLNNQACLPNCFFVNIIDHPLG